MYFFNVLLPLSWMAYEVREFTVFLIHETDSQYAIRRKYIEEMDREVREILPTSRKRKSKLSNWDKEDISENEKKSMMEMEMGRGKERRRKRRSGRGYRHHSRDASV
jgi:arsenate reductase-like glutaredoxin family protein